MKSKLFKRIAATAAAIAIASQFAFALPANAADETTFGAAYISDGAVKIDIDSSATDTNKYKAYVASYDEDGRLTSVAVTDIVPGTETELTLNSNSNFTPSKVIILDSEHKPVLSDTTIYSTKPTEAPEVTDTPTDMPTDTNTPTDVPTNTNAPTDTPADTPTPTPTDTPTPTPAVYTVTFETNGAGEREPQLAEEGGNIDTGQNPYKTGYVFDGWYTDKEFTTKFNIFEPITKNITLYAKWLKICTVTFETNGGSSVQEQTVTEGNKAQSPNNPTKSGFAFDGWYKDEALTSAFNFSEDVITDSITVFAKWREAVNNYTVTFNTNGGSDIQAQTVKEGSKADKPADPTKTGAEFGGWYSSQSFEDEFNFDTQTITANTVLYAKWSYTVTFEMNGGRDIDSQLVREGAKASAPSNPYKSGAVFADWYKDEALTEVFDFDSETITKNTTVYAKWNCYLSFNTNGGFAIERQLVPEGGKAVKPEDPERSRADFVGWYKDEAMTVPFDFETERINKNTTIFAKWSYTITFDSDGGSEIAPITYTGGSIEKPADPIKDGYTFAYWHDENYQMEFSFEEPLISHHTTLRAIWLKNYTVTFNMAGGDAVDAQTVASGEKAQKPQDPTRENYTFAGWYAEPDYKTPFNFDTAITEDTTVYAKWEAAVVKYTVAFSTGDGSAVPSQTVDQGGKAQKPSPDPTYAGYVFDNWYSDTDYEDVFDFDAAITASITVYAKWLKEYTVTFDTGAGASSVEAQKAADGKTVSEPATTPSKDGYAFDGWYMDKDCTVEFNFETTKITDDITIYAKWAETFTVQFDSKGAESVETKIVKSGDTITAPETPVKTTGATEFGGWYSDSDYKTEFDFANTKITEDITLYAKWVYTVSFDSNGGSAVNPIKAAENTTAAAPATPTLADKVFAGWYSDAALNNEFDFDTPITEDITLYAKWNDAEHDYTISFDTNGAGAVASQTVREGTTASKPADPEKDGFTFAGWYTDNDTFKNEFSFESGITEDITVYAKWLEKFAVTFEGADGVDTQYVTDGTTASKPDPDPVKTKAEFGGWYKDNTFKTPFNFDTEKITAPATVYAKWTNIYTVTFVTGTSDTIPSQDIKEGGFASKPDDPSRDGYKFGGWYTDNNTEFVFASTKVTEDLTLTADWLNIYTVKFETNGGTAVADQEVVTGETIKAVTTTKENAEFEGWYTDMGLTQKIDPAAWKVESDTTLYAKWTSTLANVSYSVSVTANNSGAAAADITVTYDGSPIAAEAKMTEGKTFTVAAAAKEGYTAGVSVTSGGEALTPNAEGEYTVGKQDIAIAVTYTENVVSFADGAVKAVALRYDAADSTYAQLKLAGAKTVKNETADEITYREGVLVTQQASNLSTEASRSPVIIQIDKTNLDNKRVTLSFNARADYGSSDIYLRQLAENPSDLGSLTYNTLPETKSNILLTKNGGTAEHAVTYDITGILDESDSNKVSFEIISVSIRTQILSAFNLDAKQLYPVTVAQTVTNGTITSDKSQAIEGETVTLTVSPSDGYKFDGFTAIEGVTFTGDTSPYTFAMPAKAVEISGTFSEVVGTPAGLKVAYSLDGTDDKVITAIPATEIVAADGQYTVEKPQTYTFTDSDKAVIQSRKITAADSVTGLKKVYTYKEGLPDSTAVDAADKIVYVTVEEAGDYYYYEDFLDYKVGNDPEIDGSFAGSNMLRRLAETVDTQTKVFNAYGTDKSGSSDLIFGSGSLAAGKTVTLKMKYMLSQSNTGAAATWTLRGSNGNAIIALRNNSGWNVSNVDILIGDTVVQNVTNFKSTQDTAINPNVSNRHRTEWLDVEAVIDLTRKAHNVKLNITGASGTKYVTDATGTTTAEDINLLHAQNGAGYFAYAIDDMTIAPAAANTLDHYDISSAFDTGAILTTETSRYIGNVSAKALDGDNQEVTEGITTTWYAADSTGALVPGITISNTGAVTINNTVKAGNYKIIVADIMSGKNAYEEITISDSGTETVLYATEDFEEKTADTSLFTPGEGMTIENEAANDIGYVLKFGSTAGSAALDLSTAPIAVAKDEKLEISFNPYHGWFSKAKDAEIKITNSSGNELLSYTYANASTYITAISVAGVKQEIPENYGFSLGNYWHDSDTSKQYVKNGNTVALTINGNGTISAKFTNRTGVSHTFTAKAADYGSNLGAGGLSFGKAVFTNNMTNDANRSGGLDNFKTTVTRNEYHNVSFTVTTEDSDLSTAGVPVRISDADGVLWGIATTDDTGKASISIPQGSYTYEIYKADYNEIPTTAFTVENADVPITIPIAKNSTKPVNVYVQRKTESGTLVGEPTLIDPATSATQTTYFADDTIKAADLAEYKNVFKVINNDNTFYRYEYISGLDDTITLTSDKLTDDLTEGQSGKQAYTITVIVDSPLYYVYEDYENDSDTKQFTSVNRSSATIVTDSNLGSKVQKIKAADNAGNAYAMAQYVLPTAFTEGNVTVEYDISMGGGNNRAIVSIGDSGLRAWGKGQSGYSSKGVIFKAGFDKTKLDGDKSSEERVFLVSNANLARYAVTDWIHVKAVINLTDKKVTYTITKTQDEAQAVLFTNTIDYLNTTADETALKLDEIDVWEYVSDHFCHIDNLKVYTTD